MVMSDMGPDLELKGRSYISREASGSKEPVPVMEELENNHMKCARECEDKNLDMQVETIERTKGAFRNLEAETNTLEGAKSGDINPVQEGWDSALTESSSSFDSGGTSFSEAEVDSEFNDALSSFPFDGYGDLFRMRKKKLTSNWRKYIGPLMWRCKWVELQIKKFESQAQKYDREIAAYNGRESFENCSIENVNSKSFPFNAQSRRKSVMKRKKRRKDEDRDDIESYMSHHNLFSYFENKKFAADAACTDAIWGNQGPGADKTCNGTNEIGVDEELLSCEFKDGGDSLEQMFWKIGLMQWQVREMKARAHKILSENALRYCSTENLSLLVPCNNAVTSPAENPASPLNNEEKHAIAASPLNNEEKHAIAASPLNNEEKHAIAASPLNEEKHAIAASISSDIVRDDIDTKMVDVSMPESAALGHGKVNNVTENKKSINPPEIGGSSRNRSGAILIYNRRAKTSKSKSKELDTVSTQKPHGSNQDHESSAIVPFSQDPKSSTPKIRSISEMMSTSITGITCNKRKRAMRKAGFGKWNH